MTNENYLSKEKCNKLIDNFKRRNSEKTKNELLDFFRKTPVYEFIDKISIAFCDSLDEDFLPAMIEKIDSIRNSKHISTLVYCCSEYDCSRFLFFFTKLFIELDDSVVSQIIGIVEEMKGPLKLRDKNESKKIINEFILALSPNSKRFREAIYVKELIDKF